MPKISEQKASPDLLVIAAEKSIGIQKVRDLEKFLILKPYEGNFKVVLICEAEKLTVEAQEALLKTLEEPPESGKIILCAADRDYLLPTVISRCLHLPVHFKPQFEIPADRQQTIIDQLEKLLDGEIANKLILASQISPDANVWLEEETILWRDLLFAKIGLGDWLTLGAAAGKIKKIASQLTEKKIVEVLSKLSSIKKALEANVNTRLSIEALLLNFPFLAKKSESQQK